MVDSLTLFFKSISQGMASEFYPNLQRQRDAYAVTPSSSSSSWMALRILILYKTQAHRWNGQLSSFRLPVYVSE